MTNPSGCPTKWELGESFLTHRQNPVRWVCETNPSRRIAFFFDRRRFPMHREISHTDAAFGEESNLPVYLMTGLLAALMALDLLPRFGAWMGWTYFPGWPLVVVT